MEEYHRPSLLFNSHLETIYPALFRKVVIKKHIENQKIVTPDEDFLDLHWIKSRNKKLIIIQHGLEGSWNRPYMLGMARIFSDHGYDVCLWSYRGCGGNLNDQPIFYHSGATYDLDLVVQEGIKNYDDISLLGFSLGGNLTLKYLGERQLDHRVKRGVAISVPVDLASGADNLSTPKCYIYEKRFLKNLLIKVKEKHLKLPGKIDMSHFGDVKTIRDFDEYFTAPLHGFAGADDYYQNNSSQYFLEGIKVPTLILNALNDPLLTAPSYDLSLTSSNKHLTHLLTHQGGHVGFTEFRTDGYFWSERKAIDFCQSH